MTRIVFFFILAVGLCAGCREPATQDSVRYYDEHGVSFEYPLQWRITKDLLQQNKRFIYIEHPDRSLLAINILPSVVAEDLSAYARKFSADASQRVAVGKVETRPFKTFTVTIDDQPVKGLEETFAIEVDGQSVRHVRQYLRVDQNNRSAFLISQSAEEDLANARRDWRQIQQTLDLGVRPEN